MCDHDRPLTMSAMPPVGSGTLAEEEKRKKREEEEGEPSSVAIGRRDRVEYCPDTVW